MEVPAISEVKQWQDLPIKLQWQVLSWVLRRGTILDFENLKSVNHNWLAYIRDATNEKNSFALFIEQNPREAARFFVKASGAGKKAIVQAFIKAGIDINTRAAFQKAGHMLRAETALTYAVKKQQIEMVKLLLEHKADIACKNNRCMTPLRIAVTSAFKKRKQALCVPIAELLIRNGANVNEHDGLLLISAKQTEHQELIELLLHFGAHESHQILIENDDQVISDFNTTPKPPHTFIHMSSNVSDTCRFWNTSIKYPKFSGL